MIQFLKKYLFTHRILLLLYYVLYLPWFTWLQRRTGVSFAIMHIGLDDLIPFCEYFLIPYLGWFIYVPAVEIYLYFKDPEYFTRSCITMYIGMTLALTVYTVWPNGQDLRPMLSELGRSNIFTKGMAILWGTDPAINVCPSVHVLNTLAMHYSLCAAPCMKQKRLIKWLSFIFALLVILSTVFLKQHSTVDVFAAILLSVPLYYIAFKPKWHCLRWFWEDQK